MPEFRPISATTHLKCAFDILSDSEEPLMKSLRYTIREWCIKRKVKTDTSRLYESWFFQGNPPSDPNVVINGQQMRTAIAPGDDVNEPPAWAFELVHTDSAIPTRRWSAEVMLKREDPNRVRFSTVISHWMIPNYIGEYPDMPAISVPNYVAWLLKDANLECRKGNTVVSNQFEIVTHDNAQDVYDQLKDSDREQPFVFVAAVPGTNRLAVDPVQLYRYLLGNANVYAFFEPSALEEMNYYLGNAYRCELGSVRCYLPYFDRTRTDNARIHRYFAASDIEDRGQQYVVNCIANGLAKNGSVFRPRDLRSFSDLFVYRRKLRLDRVIKEAKASADTSEISEELKLFQDECESLDARNQEIQSQLDQFKAENESLNKELSVKDYQIAEAEKLRTQFQGLEQAQNALKSLNRLPASLPEVLSLAGELFPRKLAFAQTAFKTAGEHAKKNNYWAKPEGLSLAWELLVSLATTGHGLLLSGKDGDLEKEFNDQSRFDLAMTEGKTTKSNKKMMGERVFRFDGKEYEMTPHLKYGNKLPKLLRVYFAIDNDNDRLIVGHFGEHLKNASSRKRS